MTLRLAALLLAAAVGLSACKREPEAPPRSPHAFDAPAPARPPTKLTPKQEDGVLAFFEGAEHDFGEIREGENVKHAFRFRNTGAEPVTISRVQASCGCTAALASAETIAPGAEGEIGVEFRSKGHPGRANKAITVYSNDPEQPQRRLALKGVVRADAELDPPFLNWGPIRQGQERRDRVRLRLEPGIEVKGVDSSSPLLAAEAAEEDGARFVRLALSAEAPLGPFAARVAVRTTSETRPELTLAVNARLQGDAEVTPEGISFGAVRLGAQERRTVRIQHLDGKAFSILGVTTTSPTILAEAEPVGPPGAYEIVVRNAVADAQGSIRGEVRVRTDLPKQPEIVIPVFGANVAR